MLKKELKRTAYSESIIIILYICSIISSIAAALHFSSLFFHYDLSEIGSGIFLRAVIILIFFSLLSLYFGRKFYKKNDSGFYTTTISTLLAITVPVGIIEVAGSKTIPPWPAIELHGVSPEIGKEAWGRIQSLNHRAIGNNSWGQRDREHPIAPPAGKIRIAFIGDSLLEESSVTPVSLLVESSLPPAFEVINLGVSATNPIDYYWRLRNVALKLGVKHVFIFIYIGNDLLDKKPVNNRGITNTLFAPPPISSLLGTLTPTINYHLTKKYKQSTNTWLTNDFHHKEQSILKEFRKINSNDFPRVLAMGAPRKKQGRCYDALSTLDLRDFYQMLTHPDMGLFRTYILEDAIKSFCHPRRKSKAKPSANTGSYTLRMINLMRELSLKKDVGFSVVIIPQGFDVDDRMWSQWKVLADFRENYKHSLKASIFKDLLLENSVHTIDLYPAFESKKGTYLNIDGHWSKLGNEIAAKTLAQQIIELDIN